MSRRRSTADRFRHSIRIVTRHNLWRRHNSIVTQLDNTKSLMTSTVPPVLTLLYTHALKGEISLSLRLTAAARNHVARGRCSEVDSAASVTSECHQHQRHCSALQVTSRPVAAPEQLCGSGTVQAAARAASVQKQISHKVTPHYNHNDLHNVMLQFDCH